MAVIGVLAITFSMCRPESQSSFTELSGMQAAAEAKIEAAIEKGLIYLANQQADDGRWRYSSIEYELGITGLVLLKFVDRAKELGLDPFDNGPGGYEYADNVISGFNWMFNHVYDHPEGVNVRGRTYQTAIAMAALSATSAPGRVISTGPLADWTYGQALEGMMTWMSGAQSTVVSCYQGGWSYGFFSSTSDQSNTGYATLGIGFAAAPSPQGFGFSIPADMLDGLSVFIGNIQEANGGSSYSPCTTAYVNILNTGKLLYEMALVGDEITDPRVVDALGFIEDHWEYTSTGLSSGWKDSYQAMFTMMKGLEAFNIQTINLEGTDEDWFNLVSDFIIDHQEPDGSFAEVNVQWGEESPNLRTAWALLTLEKVTPIKNEPPVCDANGPYSLECTGSTVDVTLDGTGSYDPDGDILTYRWTGLFNEGSVSGPTPVVQFPEMGTYVVNLEVSDGEATDQCTANVTIEDTTPPSISLNVSPDELWPPNHKMVPISVDVTVSDTCGTDPQYSLLSITSNEEDNTRGDGNTNNDIEIDEDGFISLRAERSGLGDGRIYVITYEATDQSGNMATASDTVIVPHNQ